MPELTFDEPSHTYRLDGVVIPGVTTVLKVLGGYEGVPQRLLDIAAERGQAIHRATELLDHGDLDWGSLDDELIPYVQAYGNFLDDKRPEIVLIETRTYHPTLKFAGTLDRGFILGGHKAMVDLKSSWQLMPATGPQTAAYAECVNAHEPNRKEHFKRRYGLQLKRDGTYNLHEYKEPTDWNTFVSCLNVHRWRERHQKQ